jgi:hypothetical protein
MIMSILPGTTVIDLVYSCRRHFLPHLDVVAGHTINWWDQPNALVLGAGATTFVAYVILITEIPRGLRSPRRT